MKTARAAAAVIAVALLASCATGSAARFDPSMAQPGDVVLGLRIRDIDVRAHPDGGEWYGSVDFHGGVQLTGEYRPHPDSPSTNLLCFYPDPASARKLPKFPNDHRVSWFCFSNQRDARTLLDSPSAVGTATVAVDDFHYHFVPSDVFNEARLLRVIEKTAR